MGRVVAGIKAGVQSEKHLSALALIVCAYVPGIYALGAFSDGDWIQGVFLTALAVGALLVSLRLVPEHETFLSRAEEVQHEEVHHSRLGLAASVAAVMIALITSIHLALHPYIDWSLPLLPLAALLGWLGEGWIRGQGPRAQVQLIARSASKHRIEVLVLLVLIVCGLALRIWIATQYALLTGTMNDEQTIGDLAWQLVHGTNPWPLYVVEHGAAAMYQPVALVFALFGASMTSFRVTFAVESALLIPAFYTLARQFAAAPAALCCTALLALAYWPATLGAEAFGMMYGAVFQSLGLALLLYGLRHARYSASATGGGVLALCFYSYIAHRMMVLAAIPVLLFYLFWGGDAVWRRLRQILAFCAGFSVVFAPWVGTIVLHPDLLFGDAAEIGVDYRHTLYTHPLEGIRIALTAAGRLAMTIMASPQASTYFPLPSGGLLDAITAGLVFLGAGYALIRIWRPQNLMILFGLLPPLVTGSLVGLDGINVYRLGSLVPTLFLAATLLLDRCVRLASSASRSMLITYVALAAIAAGAGYRNVHAVVTYVGDPAYLCQVTNMFQVGQPENALVARTANAFGPRQAIFIVTRNHGYDEPTTGPWLYHVPPPVWIESQEVPGDPARWSPTFVSPPPQKGPFAATFWPPQIGPDQTGITYIIFSDSSDVLLPLLRRRFPGGQERTVLIDGCPSTWHLITYSLSRRQLAAHRAS